MFSNFLHHQAGLMATCSTIAVVGVGIISPSAHAINLVPQQEIEIQLYKEDGGLLTQMDCLTGVGNCLELDPSIFKSVISEVDKSTGTRSYLFVDSKGTENEYDDTVNGGKFTFGSVDLGTTEPEGQYWFRPVAVNSDGSLIEGGELEVGTFTFEFAKTLSELTLSFFDTETQPGTSFEVFYANATSEIITVDKASNSNIQEFTLSDVEKITLNLGEHYGRTGDGVNFQGTASVPEPSVALGAIAAVIGGGLLRRGRQAATEA